MKSFKLTNQMKTNIVSDILKYRFYEGVNEMRIRYAKLAIAIYDSSLSVDDKTIIRLAKDTGWIPDCNYISAKSSYSLYCHVLYYNGVHNLSRELWSWMTEVDSIDLPTKRQLTPVKMPEKFGKALQILEGECVSLENTIKSAKEKTSNILNAYTTSRQLIEMWPEVEHFLSKYIPVSKQKGALVIQSAEMNKLLNLPV